MATHGAPAQQGRVPLPPVFQASASSAATSASAGHHSHRQHSTGNHQQRDLSVYETTLALAERVRAWYTAPCTLPPHRREPTLKLAVLVVLFFAFIFFTNWIVAAWRSRGAGRIKKLQ